MNFTCPACGFDGLRFVPWRIKLLPDGTQVWRTSHEICAGCGIEFGRDDWAGGDVVERALVHERWGERQRKRKAS
jgi:hypothetical protein